MSSPPMTVTLYRRPGCPGFVIADAGILLNPALFGSFSELEIEERYGQLELRGDGYPLGPARDVDVLGDQALDWWQQAGKRVFDNLCDWEAHHRSGSQGEADRIRPATVHRLRRANYCSGGLLR